jgi:general secretion pathway protein F/type IV pilus assembly protein PilC
MPEFVYTARTLAGEDVAGTIACGSRKETLQALAEKSLFPIHVAEKPTQKWLVRKHVKPQLLSGTLNQLADLLENGVPLLDGLQILVEQSNHAALAEVLTDVRDQVSEGMPLDEAMTRHASLFGPLTISMVRAGAEGAFLEEALKRTAKFMETQQELKARVKGAMIYPAFLAAMGLTVTVVLVVFFVPKFSELFARLEQEGGGLPAVTVVLLTMSDVLGKYGLFVGAAAIGLVWWLRRLAATERGQLLVDRWKLKIPLAGPIFLGYAVSRFSRVLGTLLRNGVPLLRSLEISSDSAGNRVLADAIRQSSENVTAGETLSGPLAKCGLIPPSVMAMIRVAEEANNLDDVLISVADSVDRTTARQIDIMVRMAEPLMLLFMGVMIGFVLVALLLPVFDTMTLMG